MYEDIKQRLRNYKKILAKRNEYELQIKELEEDIGITEPPQGEATGKTYKISSVSENQAIELAEKKLRLQELININQKEIDHIQNALSGLREWERQAIELRFVEERRIESVCYIMNRAKKTINKYIANGLKEMHEILKDDIA
ncbi:MULTISPECIES: DNA-directed RNA polymerase specialized sigma subunit, sigma24 [unclassified Clostridium]|uniref:DNA-directed RNA polymerase specialized sigma subunit, sigma24 n=1 Tax=unclassified Clostridium TaxID=2614128 RepID=UPI00029809C4|nr:MULTISPECIES: DNA-directed RNA polymerase specialized sigma subunit, sigma24 [unclassified Clostridium]EKQ56284.1 MAG: DNA-directed RNA polymerase specialized sigma subunit, sigma24 [Clostridium sp. Maddingley MBC34-26]